MEKFCILVADDDREIVKALEIYLKTDGYEVLKAYDGNEAVKLLRQNEVHLALLDIMMPVKDGISALQEIRKEKNIPVIFLSAKSEDTDKILGLKLGGDDYITKPFNPLELLARIKSQLRRYTQLGTIESKSEKLIKNGGLVLNSESKCLTVDGENVRLTNIEYKIIELLMKNAGRVFSMEEIYSFVWNEPSYSVENTVAVHIRHIREKIEINPKNPKYLKVVWGIGYKIEKY